MSQLIRALIIDLLQRHRLPLSDEKQLQAEMAKLFDTACLSFKREVRLDNRDIVDFMVDDLIQDTKAVAIEVKIKGSARSIYRQLERYAAHDAVGAIVLATNVAMGLPETINGKPVSIAALGRGWL